MVFGFNPPPFKIPLVKSDFQKVIFSDFQNHTTIFDFLENALYTYLPVKSKHFEEGVGI